MPKKKVIQIDKATPEPETRLKRKFRSKIVKACKAAGTYRPEFDMVIDDLANILVMRENAIQSYIKHGNTTIIEHVNIGGNANLIKNPAVILIIEINQLALAYWRELGLTPKGFKSLGAEVLKDEERAGLDKLIEELGI